MSTAKVRERSAFLSLAVCLIGLTQAVFAQQTTATVQGSVKDQAGGVVAGARVELINTGAGIIITQATNEDGAYLFNAVMPGNYRIRAAAQGFKQTESDALPIEVGKNIRFDFTLSPGAVNESVSVRADALTVDTVSTAVSTSLNTKLITDLPNFNRFGLASVAAAPGLDLRISGGAFGQLINVEGAYAATNGNRLGQNSWYLDGAENAGSWRNGAMQFPNPDAIQEVQVQTSNTSAEYGKQPGAVINAIAKSGTNELHGTGFYFTHNENFNANSFNNNARGVARPVDNQRNWGGVVGGPVFKNKTFFFASFNRFDFSTPSSQLYRLPTPAMLRGDFSEVPDFVQANGTRVPFNIRDPETGAPLGKVIPASMINPVAKNLLPLFPTISNYYDLFLRAYVRPTRNNEVLGKVDHHINAKHQVSFTYLANFGGNVDPGGFGNQLDAWGTFDANVKNHSGTARHFWVISPTMTVESRFSVLNVNNPRSSSVAGKDLTDFGAKMPYSYPVKGFPGMNVSGLGAGVIGNTDAIDQSNYRANSRMSWVIGRHNLRFGGETEKLINPIYALGTNRTQFNFSGNFSLNGPRQNGVQYPAPGNFGNQNIAYSWADFLLGRVDSFNLTQVWGNSVSYWQHSAFVQDEWKVMPRLNLSLGMRYELYSDVKEINNHLGGLYYRDHQSDLFPKAPLGLGFVGDRGIPPGLIPQDRNNLAPRVGLAYDVFGDGKTVVRGAFGVYHSAPSLGVLRQNAGGAWKNDLPGGNALLNDPVGTSRFFPWDTTFRYGPNNPPPNPAGTISPNDQRWENNFVTAPVNGVTMRVYNASLLGFDQSLVTPYSLQWNLAVERELTRGLVVSANYVANRALRLTDWQEINYATWRAGANTSAQSIRDRRIDPRYSSIRLFQSQLRAAYDSLQLVGHLRSFHGVTAELSYVYGKLITPWTDRSGDVIFNTGGSVAYPQDRNLDRAENLNRHTFKAYFVYDLPFLRADKSLFGKLLGGWVASGNLFARSGSPLNVLWGFDANADGQGEDRPNLVAPIKYTSGNKDQRSASYLDRASFSSPCGAGVAVNTNCNVFGSLGRNAVWGEGLWQLDGAMLKNFRITERYQAQFRWEVVNLTNTNFLGTPNLNLGQGTNPDFGRILTRNHTPRQMQIGVKFMF